MLEHRVSRRSVERPTAVWRVTVAAGAGLVALALAFVASAATPQAPTSGKRNITVPSYLYVHDAEAGTFSAVRGTPGLYRLALTGVVPTALYFSDRPYRRVGSEQLGRMLAGFFGKPDQILPNAAVQATDPGTGKLMLMGVELLKGAYDWKRRTLVYTVKRLKEGPAPTRLAGKTDRLLPARLGTTTLFIDDYGHNSCSVTLTDTAHSWTVVSATLNNSNDSWGVESPWGSTANGYPANWGGAAAGTAAASTTYGSISGFDRGCSNTVLFLNKAAGVVLTVSVSDPYSGSNSYSCTLSDPGYSCGNAYGILGGDQLSAEWTITGP